MIPEHGVKLHVPFQKAGVGTFELLREMTAPAVGVNVVPRRNDEIERGNIIAPAPMDAIDINACRLLSRPLFFSFKLSSILLAMYFLRSKGTR